MSELPKNPSRIYCEKCNRVLTPSNLEDVEKGIVENYIYIHDQVDHDGKPLHEIISTVQ